MTKPISCSSSSTRCGGLMFLFTLTLVFLYPSAVAAQQGDVRELVPGTVVEQKISAGQSHVYKVSLNANDYLRIEVAGRDTALKLEMFGPDGSRAAGACDIVDSPQSRVVSLVAAVSGLHRLTLRAPKEDQTTYQLMIQALRSVTEDDKIRLAAETAESKGLTDTSEEGWQQNTAQAEEALRLWRKLDDRKAILRMLVRLGAQYVNTGDTSTALTYYREALPLAQALDDRYAEGSTLLGMGNALHRQNEAQKALGMFAKAKQIFASISRPDREAAVVSNMALVYLVMGDSNEAIKSLQQVVQTYATLKLPKYECTVLTSLGAAYAKISERDKALESFNKALTIARENHLTGCEGRVLRHMGYLYFTLNQKEKATEFFNQGLQLCRSVGDRLCEATVLRGLGSINKSSGQYEKSLQYLSQARKLFQSCGERDREAIVLHQLADVNQALGNLDEAREQLEEALLIKESVRANVASQELRDSFFVSAQNSFALYIDVLMQLHQKYPGQHYDAAALRANERARARGLLELLAQANVDIRQGVSPDLLGRERSLQQQLNKTAARTRTPDDRNDKQSDRELEELSARLREVRAQIRVNSPRYAALTQPQPLSSNEIGQLLDDNTVLLEFGLGKKQSWLWAVTRNGVATYQLAAGDQIESTSRKVYQLLTARRPEPNLTESEQLKRIAAADSALQSEIGVLSKMLFDPVAETLRTEWKGKRLVIVGSGALEILPFAVLRNPGDPLPLIANHEIVNLPSASVLSIIRQESAGRTPPAKMVAVLADPVFETNDPRLRVASGRTVSNQHPQAAGLPASTNGADSPLQRSIRSMNQGSLSRLPFSREEANAISALVSPTSVLKATDFRANRERATSGELSNYQIIHFATHALLNSEHPELSGLVLSLVDENGQPQDGFLRVNELYNMRLPANLVVLSACQTGLGKEIRGEGLIGLTRGFMYAGAQRVVASLWQVDDLATAQLMKEFYRGMLKDKLPPAAALRAAQLSMMKDKRWESPYFWAAFTIQGEWK